MVTNNVVIVAIYCDKNNPDSVDTFRRLYARYKVLDNCTELVAQCFKNIERDVVLLSNLSMVGLVSRFSKDLSLDIKKELADMAEKDVKPWLSQKNVYDWIVNNSRDRCFVKEISDIMEAGKEEYFFVTFGCEKWINSKSDFVSIDDFHEIKYGLLKQRKIGMEYIHLCPELNIKTKTDICGKFFLQTHVYYQTSTDTLYTYVGEESFIINSHIGPINTVEQIEAYYSDKPDYVVGELEYVM